MLNNLKNNNLNFLQSEEWRKFQSAVGRRTFFVSEGNFQANIIEHKLPIVGKYFYSPRGPVMELDSSSASWRIGMTTLLTLAKKENIGWIRIDPENEEMLNLIKNSTEYKIRKAPHDMQPKEIFIMDISKSEEEILAEMSQKTRYNINLSQKRGVSVKVISNFQFPISNQTPISNDQNKKYIDEFIRLVKLTEKRKNIRFHASEYYKKMLETIPGEIIKLYVAEYRDKIIAANLVVFYEDTAIYLHGATDDEYRNVMAPYLLQWQAILDAKKNGCKLYDFGGVKMQKANSWAGITKFKLGFSPQTKPVEFSGSYDIILNQQIYLLYRIIQKIKSIF